MTQTKIMKALLQVLQLFPYVLGGVVAVEQQLTGSAPGAKKQLIMNAIQTAAEVGEQVPNSNVAVVSSLIDIIVTDLNASGVFTHGAPATPATPVAT